MTLSAYGSALNGYTDFLRSLIRTIEISAVVALVTLVLGYPVAYVAVRLRPGARAALVGSIALPFFTSALVRTYAWQVLLANNGFVNRVLTDLRLVSRPLTLVYSDTGVVIGMAQVLLPMMVFPLFSTMRRIDPQLTRAAQAMGASPLRAWYSVYLQLTKSGIAAGLTIVFVTAIGFYTTPALLGGPSTPLLAQRTDSLINLPGERQQICAESAIMLALAVVVILVFRRQLGLVLDATDDSERGTSRSSPIIARVLGHLPALRISPHGLEAGRKALRLVEDWVSRGRYIVVGLLTIAGVTISMLPLVVIVIVSFSSSDLLSFPPPGYSTRWFSAYLHDPAFLSSTRFSIWISGLGTIIAVCVGALAAYYVARAKSRRLRAVSYLAMVSPMVMPQIVLAVGLFFTFEPTSLNGSPWSLVLAYTILSLPVCAILLTEAFRGLDPTFERAAASLGAAGPRVARTILAPLIFPALCGALVLGFVIGFDDLVMAQYLGGLNSQTLVKRMYDNIREEISPEVAAIGTTVIVCIVVVVVVTMALRSAVRRIGPRVVSLMIGRG